MESLFCVCVVIRMWILDFSHLYIHSHEIWCDLFSKLLCLYLSWGKVILCVHRGLCIFTLIFKDWLGTIFFFFKENTSLSSTEGSLFMIITFFPPKDGKKIPRLVWPRVASERPVHGQKCSPWFSSLVWGWSGVRECQSWVNRTQKLGWGFSQ